MPEERPSCVAYLVQPRRGDAIEFAVIDVERGQFHTFAISYLALARVVAEGADALRDHLTGFSGKFTTQEIAAALSARTVAPSGDAK